MSDHVRVPVKIVGADKWGQLCLLGEQHYICAEKVQLKEQAFSFAGQHRVRLYSFKKNVHWKIPAGIALDITDVNPANAPRRQMNR